jgi:hypothetical protein
MRFSPFLLDDWLNSHQHSEPPVEFDLASSTGPYWTLRELLGLGEKNALEELLDTRLAYARAAGSRDLLRAIAEMEGVDAEQVQVTTGAAEALLLLFAVTAEPGANVLVPSPSFPSFYEIPRALGLEFRFYSVRRENQFRVDPDEICSLADARTKLLLVNTPHNPTGAILTDDELTALHDFCVSRGIQFVSDQVYHPIYHGCPTATAARLPHATVVSDFSKALCLSGLRLAGLWTVMPRAWSNTARVTGISPCRGPRSGSRWPRSRCATAKKSWPARSRSAQPILRCSRNSWLNTPLRLDGYVHRAASQLSHGCTRARTRAPCVRKRLALACCSRRAIASECLHTSALDLAPRPSNFRKRSRASRMSCTDALPTQPQPARFKANA